MSESLPYGASITVQGSPLGSSLTSILLADDIVPGADPSYELCKQLYLYHPLGQKMVEAPIALAQSQAREITVQDAPKEVAEEHRKEWKKLNTNRHIYMTMTIARAYGLSSVVIGVVDEAPDKPLELTDLWKKEIYFSVFDPLNLSGSMVINQVPNAPDFNKPLDPVVSGVHYHRSRACTVLNENPVYLAYTSAAFGFSGRSVFQRALFPLKSFVRSMQADDMIATKLGLLIAKQKAPGSIISQVMDKIAGLKRSLLQQARTFNVLTIDPEESIETLNMQNVDGAGTYSRTNILKNCATAADMPAKLLENETMVAGFGEGTEDAKNIARYVERFRESMEPLYTWFDNIVQYRAWNASFFERMQKLYPERYSNREYKDVFYEWQNSFTAEWPSLLIEPESERAKTDDVRLKAIIALLQVLLPEMDAANKARVLQFAQDNVSKNETLLPYALQLDFEALYTHFEELEQRAQASAEALSSGAEETEKEPEAAPPFSARDAQPHLVVAKG